jgi:Transposase DDE domain group 1
LAGVNRDLIAKAEAIDAQQRIVLDMDLTEIRVYGQQENSAYNGHFESTCYHPLLLFNRKATAWRQSCGPATSTVPKTGKSCFCRRLNGSRRWARKLCSGPTQVKTGGGLVEHTRYYC